MGTARAICCREEWMTKPRIFVDSSGKQEKLLQALARGLEDVAHVEPWTTSFNPGTTTLERLLELTHEVDFAAFVFAQDDWTTNSQLPSTPPGTDQVYTGADVASARDFGPGSVVMMPANWVHVSGCRPGSDCVFYQDGKGKFDFKPASEQGA
jgi:hypothetical protein